MTEVFRDAVHEVARRHAARHDSVRLATISSLDPFEVELIDAQHVLGADEVDLSSWMQLLLDNGRLAEDDTVILARKDAGGSVTWIAHDAVSDLALDLIARSELDLKQDAATAATDAELAAHAATKTGVHGIPALANGQGLLWSGAGWTATDLATQAELDAVNTALGARVTTLERAKTRGLDGPVAGPTYGAAGTIYNTVALTTHGGPIRVDFSGIVLHNGVNGTAYRLQVEVRLDGAAGSVVPMGDWTESRAGYSSTMGGSFVYTGVAAGAHTVTARITAVTATPAIGMYSNRLLAVELPA